MTCQNIDLYGAANIPVCIGFGDSTPLVLELRNGDGDSLLTGTCVVTLKVLKLNGREAVSLGGVVDTGADTVSFTFNTAFWNGLSQQTDYTYKMVLTDGADITTVLAADFITR